MGLQDQVDVLCHIRSVQVVVVLHRSLVLVVDLHEKLKEFVVVHRLKQVVLLQQRSCHEGHLHIAPNCLREIEDVEVEGVDFEVKVLVFQDELVDVVYREVEVDSIRVDSNFLELGRVVRVMPVRSFHNFF